MLGMLKKRFVKKGPSMKRIAFITCADLSRYFVSPKNPLFTHDDQLACDYLEENGFEVIPLIWGKDLSSIKKLNLDMLIIRSPWDYSNNEHNRKSFFHWLNMLYQEKLPLLNPFLVQKWNLDKSYLFELAEAGITIPPTILLNHEKPLSDITTALKRWERIVLKPCVSAAAKDTFLINHEDWSKISEEFAGLRKNRDFIIQPFLPKISEGEWSIIFLNEQYSHAVLKKPKLGHWLVQDELGGSVQSLEPTKEIIGFANHCFKLLKKCLLEKFAQDFFLLYARIDILPGLMLGELELVEPELFFMERRFNKPNKNALIKFAKGIENFILNYPRSVIK